MPTASFADIAPSVASFDDIAPQKNIASFDDIAPARKNVASFDDIASAQLAPSPAPKTSVWDRIQQTVGRAIPDAAMGPLATANKYAVEPFEHLAQRGAEAGRSMGEEAVGSYERLRHPGIEMRQGPAGPYLVSARPMVGPEGDVALAEREHPYLAGAARGVGSVVGGIVADPRSWPLFASSTARPILQRLISGGFGAQMGAGTLAGAKELAKNWDALTPAQRSELATRTGLSGLMATAAAAHAVISHSPTSPVGHLLHEQAPDVRLVDSSAAAHELLENDTVLPPIGRIDDPALADVTAQSRGRAAEIAAKYPVQAVRPQPQESRQVVGSEAAAVRDTDTFAQVKNEHPDWTLSQIAQEAASRVNPPNAEARLTGSSDIAALRRGRTVSQDHVPVVSRNEVLAEAVQAMISNSGELAKLGLDPAKITSPADAEAMLQQAASHIQTNLDPRASATLTFDLQKQLASELGMTVEELLSRKSGQSFNAEQAIAARALLNDSGLNVVKTAQSAVADPSSLSSMTTALAQHQAILDSVKGATAEAGRALGSFNVKDLPASRIADAMSKLPKDAQAEAARLLSKIDLDNPQHVNGFIEKITASSTADKLFELYRNSLLSGPATVIKKGVSEATMLALEATKKVAAAGLNKLQGGDSERYASESYWFAKGALDGLQHVGKALSGEFDLADRDARRAYRHAAVCDALLQNALEHRKGGGLLLAVWFLQRSRQR